MELKGIVSLLIFAVTFGLIMSERIHRAVAALLGAIAMVLAGTWMGFYDQDAAVKSIDFNTLGLLLGMMLLLAMLEKTGFFEFVAIKAARYAKGNARALFISLGTVTTVLSMFLDNVTTVVLIAPVTILIAQMLRFNPIPFLIAEAILSNTGGVATLVGDPPNIMIGSASHLSFMDFIVHLGPQVAIAWIAALVILGTRFRRELSAKPAGLEALMEMDVTAALKDRKNARRLLLVLGAVILLFFLHDHLHLKPSLIALMGAAAAFVWVRPKVEDTLKEVELSVLLFFAALFVAVGGLEHSGVLHLFAQSIVGLAKENLLLSCIVIIWISAIASALIDNIPFTMAMIPIILHLQSQGIDVNPLWWALALGVGFGGNGTPIGSTANVVVVNLSEKTKTPITIGIWMKSGLIVMLVTCLCATLTFLLFFRCMSR